MGVWGLKCKLGEGMRTSPTPPNFRFSPFYHTPSHDTHASHLTDRALTHATHLREEKGKREREWEPRGVRWEHSLRAARLATLEVLCSNSSCMSYFSFSYLDSFYNFMLFMFSWSSNCWDFSYIEKLKDVTSNRNNR